MAHRDRKALTDDGVVVAGGIADEHYAVAVWRGGPRVGAWIGRERTCRRARCHLLAPWVARDRAGGQEALGTLPTRETMLSREARAQVHAGSTTSLVEHHEEEVTFAGHHIV